jgi:hypothetical protein
VFAEKDVVDLPTRIVRALSIGGNRPETDASCTDPVGAGQGFMRGRTGSLGKPEGLKSINTSYLPLSAERAKGSSADVDSAPKNGVSSPMSYSQAQTQHPHAAPSSSSSSSTYHPRHLDLLVKPKGWKLGDKLILNARSFTLGTAHYTNCKDRDRDRDGGRDKERDKGVVRERDRGERSLAKFLDRPHLLVAALLQLA